MTIGFRFAQDKHHDEINILGPAQENPNGGR